MTAFVAARDVGLVAGDVVEWHTDAARRQWRVVTACDDAGDWWLREDEGPPFCLGGGALVRLVDQGVLW